MNVISGFKAFGLSISEMFITSGGCGECFGDDGVDHLPLVIATLIDSDRINFYKMILVLSRVEAQKGQKI